MDTAAQKELTNTDARALLADPTRWTPDHSLVVTGIDESLLSR